MVEPFAAVIRNSLFPVRSALQSTSSSLVSAAKGMHHQYQPLYFSSNFFSPVPRPTKGKEREREEPRLGRVLQCKEWSCRSTKHAFCCPARGLSFMLQELLPPRERPIRRFQNPRVQTTTRLGKRRAVHPRTSLDTQRRHASLATQSAEASTSASPSITRRDAVNRIQKLIETPLDDFDLDIAWEAFEVASTDPGCKSSLDVDVFLQFSRKFCEKVELLYNDDRKYAQLKKWSDCFQTLVNRLQELFPFPLADDRRFRALHLLIARSRALYGQEEAAIEILQRIRATWRNQYLDPDIATAYDSICASVFYYKDAFHVVSLLNQHFFYEYFQPPYCYFFRDPAAATSIQRRHHRLLSILSTIRNPVRLFRRNFGERSRDWRTIGTILILAYCEHKLPQLALRVYDVMKQSRFVLDDLLGLRLVRALARGGFFDDAQRLYDTISSDAPEYMYTGMHLFALQGDFEMAHRYYFSSRNNPNHHNNKLMLLFSLALHGKTAQVRKLFNELYPHDEHGQYMGAVPNVMDYAVVIFAYARRSHPQGISRFLKRMSQHGIRPNLHIYSTIIQSHLQSGDLNAVADVLDQMREAGVQPNAVVYTNIITALSKHHGPSTAEGVFKRALREDVKPDPPMVGALMNCYVEAGAWDKVVALFKSLDSNTKGLQLTIELYNMVLKAYVLMGAPFRVVATLFEKLDRDETVSPTDITFILLLQSACDTGHMRAAMDIFKEMDRRARRGAKHLINAYVLTILMSGFLRQGRKNQAMAVYEQMLNRGIEPTSVTYNTVLSYYANEKSSELLRVAYEFITRVAKQDEEASVMDENNVQHSPLQTVYEPLLRGYASAGNVEGFEKLLEEMLEAGGQLNIPALSSMLDLYRTKGRLESATKVWDHLLELGQETLHATALITGDQAEDSRSRMQILCIPLTIYLDILSQAGEHEEVLRVWRDYQQKGFGFNFFNWNRLGTYLIRAGEYERAFEVLDRVVLPYIRLTLDQSPRNEKDKEDKPDRKIEDNFKSPLDILNNVKLSFLQAALGRRRPLRSFARSKIIQRQLNLDPGGNNTAAMALAGLSSDPDIYSHFPSSSSSLPEFVRPLNILANSRTSDAPRPHHTLLQDLLIGYQRLRASQPAIPSTDPGSVDDYYYAEYTPEQQAKVRSQLEYIHKNFPDAVRVVLEFQMAERARLGDDYERMYIWG